MSNPTTPFSWQMPTATDLVTDLPADFEVFGQAVATSMADLLGGTSGQILAKNSNTDMDFVWIANDQGDITGITASSPLTGGGSSGAITVGIQDGTTAQKGAVQLENSTSSTSTTTAAVPASVKTSYDLAAAAIPKSTVTTNGDLIYGTGSSTVTRLGIGSTSQVLTVSGGVPSWATPSSGGGLTLISTATPSAAATVTFSSISGSYKHLLLVHTECYFANPINSYAGMRFNSDTGSNYYYHGAQVNAGTIEPIYNQTKTRFGDSMQAGIIPRSASTIGDTTDGYCWIWNYSSASLKKTVTWGAGTSTGYFPVQITGVWNSTSAITQIDLTAVTTNLTGTIQLWGVA